MSQPRFSDFKLSNTHEQNKACTFAKDKFQVKQGEPVYCCFVYPCTHILFLFSYVSCDNRSCQSADTCNVTVYNFKAKGSIFPGLKKLPNSAFSISLAPFFVLSSQPKSLFANETSFDMSLAKHFQEFKSNSKLCLNGLQFHTLISSFQKVCNNCESSCSSRQRHLPICQLCCTLRGNVAMYKISRISGIH